MFFTRFVSFCWVCFQFKTPKKASLFRVFQLKFLNIFGHILGPIEPITVIWVSLERPFPPAECNEFNVKRKHVLRACVHGCNRRYAKAHV